MWSFYKLKRRHPDSNWGIKALQASALPLGHVAPLLFMLRYSKLNVKYIGEEVVRAEFFSALRPTFPKSTAIISTVMQLMVFGLQLLARLSLLIEEFEIECI